MRRPLLHDSVPRMSRTRPVPIRTRAAILAAAALLLDYLLNVAVGISAGIEQVVSALPSLQPHTLMLCLITLGIISFVNLRGIKESGSIFAAPTYCFVTLMLLMIGVGFWQAFTGHLGTVGAVPGSDHPVLSLTGFAYVFLLLRASSQCSLTSID